MDKVLNIINNKKEESKLIKKEINDNGKNGSEKNSFIEDNENKDKERWIQINSLNESSIQSFIMENESSIHISSASNDSFQSNIKNSSIISFNSDIFNEKLDKVDSDLSFINHKILEILDQNIVKIHFQKNDVNIDHINENNIILHNNNDNSTFILSEQNINDNKSSLNNMLIKEKKLNQKEDILESEVPKSFISGKNNNNSCENNNIIQDTNATPKNHDKQNNQLKKFFFENKNEDMTVEEKIEKIPIIGGDIYNNGSSVIVLTPIRANKKNREGIYI